MAAREPDERALGGGTLRAGVGEPGGDHHDTAHSLVGALPHDLLDLPGRHRDDREVHVVGDVADAGERRDAGDMGCGGVYRIHGSVEAAGQEVAEHGATDGPDAVRGPDDGNRPGPNQTGDGPAVGALLAPLDRFDELQRGIEVEGDVDDAR